eukprot:scaffold2474_cov142-Pinguiococcus_pyrenoidosus.AAC.1
MVDTEPALILLRAMFQGRHEHILHKVLIAPQVFHVEMKLLGLVQWIADVVGHLACGVDNQRSTHKGFRNCLSYVRLDSNRRRQLEAGRFGRGLPRSCRRRRRRWICGGIAQSYCLHPRTQVQCALWSERHRSEATLGAPAYRPSSTTSMQPSVRSKPYRSW